MTEKALVLTLEPQTPGDGSPLYEEDEVDYEQQTKMNKVRFALTLGEDCEVPR